jgi:VWFA-related protein
LHVRNAVLSLAALVSSAFISHLWVSPLRADGPQPVQTFRSGRELLTIDASVRAANGKPITDLQASDFTVRIDGQPREVFTARLYAPPSPASAADANATLPSSRFVRVVDNPPGRVVVIAVDRTSIRAGGELAMLGTAADLIGKLAPSDAVGAIGLPAGAIEPTRDHAAVIAFVRSMTGAQPLSGGTATFDAHYISWEEALAYERNDRRTIAMVVERECPVEKPPQNLPGMPLVLCPPDLKTQAGQMLVVGRAQAEALLANLRNVLGNLAPLHAPKHLVLLSGGIPFDQELLSRYQELADKAAESHVALSIVHLHQNLDAMERKTFSNVFGGQEYETGLGTIASMTGGSFYTATSASTGLFDRIATDINYVYELGVESKPSDSDGKTRRVEVKIGRAGANVMAPAATASRPAPADADAAITLALQQPTDIPELPLEVAPYLTHSNDPEKVRVIVAATLGDAAVVPSHWGYVILDGRKIVAGSHVQVSSTLTGPWSAQLSTDVASGRYRLRAAAVSPDGRVGVVEIPLQVGMHAAGSMQTSDLVVGTVEDGRLQPRPQVRQDEASLGMIELSSSESLADAAGSLQLTPVGGAAPAIQAPMKLRTRADDKTVIVAEAALDLHAVPPGAYAASAVLSRGGAPVSRVSRMVTIAPGAEKATTGAPPPSTAPAFKTEPGTKPSSPEAAALMEHVAKYVDDYGTNASVIIAVEHYKQDASSGGSPVTSFAPIRGSTRGGPTVTPTGTGDVQMRTQSGKLVSEFALVRNEKAIGGWLAFRDVVEANGKPVPDRKDRLEHVLKGSAPDLEVARQISSDNARYNIGGVVRTFNVPTAALFFFNPASIGRFTYAAAGSEKVDGVAATKIEFHETARPSMIGTRTGADVFSKGFLWIDPSDGSVLRTQLNIEGYSGAGSRAVVEVFYHRDEQMEMLLPSRMTERYDMGTLHIIAEATYSDFKRFQTSATVKVK